jgi:hypothetical protein
MVVTAHRRRPKAPLQRGFRVSALRRAGPARTIRTASTPERPGTTFAVGVALPAGVAGCGEEFATEEPTVERGSGGAVKGKVATVGDRVTLKGTTYKVTKVRTAGAVGESFTRTQANGQFVLVNISLTNRKDEPATILSENLKLIGGNGKQYTTSDDALLSVDKPLLLEEIQPDNTEKGTLVYDLPGKAVKGATLRVEDLFSDSTAEIELGL